MALFLPSVAVGAISGAVGGVIFTDTVSGPTIRMNPGQILTKSQYSDIIKGNTVTLAKAWSALTAAQKATWTPFAQANPRKTPLGQTLYLPAYSMFVSVNAALKAIGITTIVKTAPSTYTASSPGTLLLSLASDLGPLTVTPATNPFTSEVPVWWATAPISTGRANVKAKFRQIGYGTPGQAGPWDITTDYIQKFELLISGNAISVQVRYTDSTSGAQGVATSSTIQVP